MMVGMASRATAKERASSVRHGANVLRAIAANLVDPGSDSAHPGSGCWRAGRLGKPLTLLAWAQPVTMGTLSGSPSLSRPACAWLTVSKPAAWCVGRAGRDPADRARPLRGRAGARLIASWEKPVM